MARVGKEQLRLLIMTASPTCILLTPDRSAEGLVKRGLFERDQYGGCCITPAGLRALAAEMQAGRVPAALAAMRADATEQRKKIAERKAAREAARRVQ